MVSRTPFFNATECAATGGARNGEKSAFKLALEVDNDDEDQDGGQEVEDVGQVLAVERLLERANLVGAGDEQVEEGDDRALELGSATVVDRRGGEGLPHDVLADVGRDEQGDSGAESVALLQKLILHAQKKENNNNNNNKRNRKIVSKKE